MLDHQVGTGGDQEQGGGAGIRKLDNLLLQLFLNSSATDIVLLTLLRTAVETAISGVHKLLRNGEVPIALKQLLFRRRSTASSVFRGSERADEPLIPAPPPPPPPRTLVPVPKPCGFCGCKATSLLTGQT